MLVGKQFFTLLVKKSQFSIFVASIQTGSLELRPQLDSLDLNYKTLKPISQHGINRVPMAV